jgi:hypothetical protein
VIKVPTCHSLAAAKPQRSGPNRTSNLARLDFFDVDGALIARDATPHTRWPHHALDLARLFDLPDGHPDRMIAASIVLCLGLGIIIAATRGITGCRRSRKGRLVPSGSGVSSVRLRQAYWRESSGRREDVDSVKSASSSAAPSIRSTKG